MIKSFEPTEQTDKSINELFSLIKNRLGHIPNAYKTLSSSKIFLTDTLYNFHKHVSKGELDVQTKHLISVAVCAALHNEDAIEARMAHAKNEGLDENIIKETITIAASIMTQNIFFKFQRLSANPDYANFRPSYKLNTILKPVFLSDLQVEAICVAISVLNDCSDCLRGHLDKFHRLGGTVSMVEELLRVVALTSGFCVAV